VQARRGLPLVSLVATGLLWTTTDLLVRYASPDVQAAAYLAWAVPAVLLLGLRLFAPQATTRSSFGSVLSTSQPSSVTATRSSMRTPVAPGT
jgi:hypothetical protein